MIRCLRTTRMQACKTNLKDGHSSSSPIHLGLMVLFPNCNLTPINRICSHPRSVLDYFLISSTHNSVTVSPSHTTTRQSCLLRTNGKKARLKLKGRCCQYHTAGWQFGIESRRGNADFLLSNVPALYTHSCPPSPLGRTEANVSDVLVISPFSLPIRKPVFLGTTIQYFLDKLGLPVPIKPNARL